MKLSPGSYYGTQDSIFVVVSSIQFFRGLINSHFKGRVVDHIIQELRIFFLSGSVELRLDVKCKSYGEWEINPN